MIRRLCILSATTLLACTAVGQAPSLEIMNPRAAESTVSRDAVNILGRTSPGTSVTVGGVEAPVFSTGIFVRDQVPLQMGKNQIAVSARAADGRESSTTITITREAEPERAAALPADKLQIEPKSTEPSEDLTLMRDDVLQVSFRGTPGKRAEFQWKPGFWVAMTEALDQDSKPAGEYRASIRITDENEVPASTIKFRLFADGAEGRAEYVSAETEAKVGVWDMSTIRLARVREDNTELGAGLHEVRLGGPSVATLTSGTILKITGKRGKNLRVQLLKDYAAWVSEREVEILPASTAVPHLYFTSVSAAGDEKVDTVVIPYSQRVPFAITPEVSPGGNAALRVDFFGAHNAATWISHRPTAKLIREVTVNQVATDHVRVIAELNSPVLWGYRSEVTTSSIRIDVRRPPAIVAGADSPLRGLRVAIEAGHGGSGDGARGISGSREKDINRMTAQALADELTSIGVSVTLVRRDDEGISLGERAQRAVAANADVFISIHANAASNDRGYLRVSGTSTYYKYPFSRDLSEAIHARLLELTKLGDFGNVGNFNYYPLRAITWMPSMLVEQAFMSNPEDEAKMLDPVFRATMAHAIQLGMEDWLKQVQAQLISK